MPARLDAPSSGLEGRALESRALFKQNAESFNKAAAN
jgi:hypothetical protein